MAGFLFARTSERDAQRRLRIASGSTRASSAAGHATAEVAPSPSAPWGYCVSAPSQNSSRSFQVAVNGQTGAIAGERPYSWIKIALASIAGVIALLLLLWVMSQSQ